jgi:hypothetical protein
MQLIEDRPVSEALAELLQEKVLPDDQECNRATPFNTTERYSEAVSWVILAKSREEVILTNARYILLHILMFLLYEKVVPTACAGR